MTVFQRLENIKTTAQELYDAGLVGEPAKNYFVRVHHSLSKEIEYFSSNPEWCEHSDLESIVNQIEEFNYVLSTIEGEADIKEHREFFNEVIQRLGSFNEIDLFVIRMPYRIPRCRFQIEEGICFILQIPSEPDYLNNNLLGLLTHEMAHVHTLIDSKVQSIKKEKRKIGESLADILAHIIVEYMLTYSSVYLIRNTIGLQGAFELRELHPSWLARISVLRGVMDDIWSNPHIAQRNIDLIINLLNLLPSLSTTEELLIQEVLREGKNWVSEWLKYKTDEDLLERLEYLDHDEVDTLEEIPKKIRELVVNV
ncbi:MAG: hypothetical protein R6U44_04255 [Archaeoglobaceae archaeon]